MKTYEEVLKEKLRYFGESEMEKIKTKFKKEEDRKREINCLIADHVSFEAFGVDRKLDDKEWDIFIDTYYYMRDYTTIINEVLAELYSKIEEKSNARSKNTAHIPE